MSIPDASGLIHAVYQDSPLSCGSALSIVDPDTAGLVDGQAQVSWNAGYPQPVYVNGVRLSDFAHISFDLDNNDPAAAVQLGGTAQPTGALHLGAYTEAESGDLQDALDAFISAVGYPWITVGALSSITWSNGTKGVLAVNLDHAGLGYSDGTTGVRFASYSDPSFGFEPWASYSAAATALAGLVRSVTWSPSS